jgi:DNA-binding CsgD family transcriptional regulator
MNSEAALVGDAELGAAAFAFATEARGLDAIIDLAAAVHRAIAPLGMTAAASGMVSGAKAASPNPFHFINWPDALIAQYMAEDFLLIDPIPRWGRSSGVALSWSDLIARLSPRDPGRKVLEAAARFGFVEGMVVPMRSGDNSVGLVSFGGQPGALSRAGQIYLTIIAREAFHAAERIEHDGDIGSAAGILSTREIECLVHLVRGHSDRQIAHLLGLSERTIRFHLDNAREKSGAVSRTHLAALAIAQGYVTL